MVAFTVLWGFLLLPITHALPKLEELERAKSSLPEGGKIWVLLTAGSIGYSNYRHQADVCHAYQVKKNCQYCSFKGVK